MKPLALVCLSGVLLLGVQLPVRASFEAERAGARATGLAGAFTAVADDADALIYNPAGLPNVKTAVFSAEHSRLFTALDTDTLTENRLAYVQPWPKVGTFGLGWYGRNLADVYQENVIVAGAGFTLDQAQTWKAGAALKLLQVAYLDSDALAANPDFFSAASSKAAVTADLGAIWNVGGGFTAGLSLGNVPEPDVSLQGGYRLPWRFRAGAAWAYADGISALDLLTTDDNERLAGGTEYWWFHRTLGTRLGLGAGNAGLLEITAGLSLHLQFSDWAPQLDYAFVNPLSDFSGVGSSHRLNLSLAWGTPVEGAQTLSGRQLKARGDEAYQRGNTEEALDAYEQAAETLPEDRILAARIEFLRAHVAHAAEIQLYLKQGLEFQKSGNYQNALAVYQKILNQEANLEAANQMAAVKAAMQRMTEEQKSEHQKQERMAAEEARQTALEESKDALQAAQRSLERARRSAEVRRWLGADLARLEKQWNAANQLWRQGEAEQAQGLAEALAREAEKLSSKAARHQTQENRAHASSETSPREETDRPAAEPTPAPAAGRLPSTPAVAEKVPGGGEKAGRTPAEENRHRRARGAYGRAVKLMLDIDKLQGQRFFPDEFSALQNEISRLKTLTAGENDTAVISYAEGLFPQMERLKAKCQEKKKVSEVMPTNW